MTRALAVVALPLMLACTTPAADRQSADPRAAAGSETAPLPPSVWGSDVAIFTVAPDAARLEEQCATVTLDSPVLVDRDGHFTASGQLHRSGGARGADAEPETVRLDGTVRSDQMTLTLARNGGTTEALRLRQGKRADLRPCP